MSGVTLFKEPQACTDDERRAFGRLVRQGFDAVAETLDGRIRDAKLLAFHYTTDRDLAAIAALKAPKQDYRVAVFKKAHVPDDPVEYATELGWIFVLPEHRRKRIGARLCRHLMARVPASSVFATTRSNNDAMIRVLDALGFAQTGRPYPRRNEELVIFLRPAGSAAE